MSICPCPNCRTSSSAVHSGVGWLLLLAALAVVVRYIYILVESIAWALFIPTAVIAAGLIAVVTRMVFKKHPVRASRPPTPRTTSEPAPVQQTVVPASDVVLAPLDARLADLIRAKASAN